MKVKKGKRETQRKKNDQVYETRNISFESLKEGKEKVLSYTRWKKKRSEVNSREKKKMKH